MTGKEFEKYLKTIGGLVRVSCTYPQIRHKICSRRFFTIGDGWLELVKNLIDKLIKIGWNKETRQCKEKFGGLRFYASSLTENGFEIINKYEKLSFEICEKCGNKGKRNTIGAPRSVYQTLCDKCKNK